MTFGAVIYTVVVSDTSVAHSPATLLPLQLYSQPMLVMLLMLLQCIPIFQSRG